MPIFKTLLLFSITTLYSLNSVEPHGNSGDFKDATAYEMLEKFNFPKGILPQGVKEYVLNEDNTFEVYLDGDCRFKVDGGYSLQYNRKITGKVGFRSLKELDGVRVKVLFLWLGITEVSRGDKDLDFHVGFMSASFPVSNFEESPRCGCGLSCNQMVSDS